MPLDDTNLLFTCHYNFNGIKWRLWKNYGSKPSVIKSTSFINFKSHSHHVKISIDFLSRDHSKLPLNILINWIDIIFDHNTNIAYNMSICPCNCKYHRSIDIKTPRMLPLSAFFKRWYQFNIQKKSYITFPISGVLLFIQFENDFLWW